MKKSRHFTFALELSDHEQALGHGQVVDEAGGHLFQRGHPLVAQANENEWQVGEEPEDAGAGRGAVGLLEEGRAQKGECDGARGVEEEEGGEQVGVGFVDDAGAEAVRYGHLLAREKIRQA